MYEKSVKELMRMIFKDPSLSQNQIKDIIDKALKIAEDSEDYSNIATNVCHDKMQADKVWGRELFKIAIEKADTEYGTSDLYDIARQIAAKEQLDDQVWAKEIYIEAIEKTENIDDLVAIADGVCDVSDINDKALGKTAIEKALSLSRNTSDKIDIIMTIASDDGLSNKEWAISIIDSIKDHLDYGNDYLMIAILYAHSKSLNDKENGREWFKKAIEVEEQYDDPDYYEIASYIYEVLGDKQWAADLCYKGYKNLENIQYLLHMAHIIYEVDPKKAKVIILYAINLVENDDKYSDDDLFNIAANISDDKLSYIPFFNDKVWGKEVFDKAIKMAPTEEEKKLIIASMDQYL